MGGENVYSGFILVEPLSIKLGDVLDRFALLQSGQDHLIAAGFNQFLAHVADVGDVFYVVDLLTLASSTRRIQSAIK